MPLTEVDLARFELPVRVSSPDENQAHEQVLLEIDKASSGKTVWRQQTAA